MGAPGFIKGWHVELGSGGQRSGVFRKIDAKHPAALAEAQNQPARTGQFNGGIVGDQRGRLGLGPQRFDELGGDGVRQILELLQDGFHPTS